jgi:putative transposase
MADHGITCSMSRSGNVWDNAAMESFFSSLKTERTARKVYRTRDDARADVFDFIERFYNPRRRHSTLGYMSPPRARGESYVSLTACPKNRQQAIAPSNTMPLITVLITTPSRMKWRIESETPR